MNIYIEKIDILDIYITYSHREDMAANISPVQFLISLVLDIFLPSFQTSPLFEYSSGVDIFDLFVHADWVEKEQAEE